MRIERILITVFIGRGYYIVHGICSTRPVGGVASLKMRIIARCKSVGFFINSNETSL